MLPTICLFCRLDNDGWNVLTGRKRKWIALGDIFKDDASDIDFNSSMGKFHPGGDNTWKDDPYQVVAIYLGINDLWCQLFWNCATTSEANRLRAMLNTPEYILDKTLPQLSPEEIQHYQR